MCSMGIGGVLINASGEILYLFSSFVGIADPIVAEVFAIHKVCIMFSSCQLLAYRNISIMSDSKSAMSWINGKCFGLLRHVNLLYNIRQILLSRKSLAIKFTTR